MQRIILLLILSAGTIAAQRRISIIVDTSNSMTENDPERYAVQITKILGDLVNDDDLVQVVRMPTVDIALAAPPTPRTVADLIAIFAGRLRQPEICSAGPTPSLAATLRGADRTGFKATIDNLLRNDTGTFFAQPVHTAMAFLGTSRASPRMLLFLADSGGFDTNCASQLTEELNRFRQTGAYVALINLGATAGSFSGNPGFDTTAAAPNSEALVRAVAQSYQRFLGGKKVQTGSVNGSVAVTVDPYVKEAFVVIAADGPIRAVDVGSGNPGAAEVEENYRGGGTTVDLRRYARGYRIVRLVNPNQGPWTISVPGVAQGGWMLIQDYSIAIQALPVLPVAAGQAARIQFEAIDTRNGRRITDPGTLAGLSVQISMGGTPVPATSNGDGTFSGSHRFAEKGRFVIQARITNNVIDRTAPVTVEVTDGGWRMVSETQDRGEVQKPVTLQVRLEPISEASVPAPDRIIAEIGGEKVEMSRAAGNTYSGIWTPVRAGREIIQFRPVNGVNTTGTSAQIEIADKPVEVARLPPPPEPPASAPVTTPSGPAPAPPPSPSSPVSPTPAESGPESGIAGPPATPLPPPAPPGFRLGPPQPLRFVALRSGRTASGVLTFDDADVPEDTELQAATSLNLRNVALEIETASGWRKLSAIPVTLRAAAGTTPSWLVRARVESCPQACALVVSHQVILTTARAEGGVDRTEVPLNIEVTADGWLKCNWKLPALSAAALLTLLLTYLNWRRRKARQSLFL